MRPLGYLSFKLIVLLLCPLLATAVFSRSGSDRKASEKTPSDYSAALEEAPPAEDTMGVDSASGLVLPDTLRGRRRPPEEKIPDANPVQRWTVIGFFAVGVGILVYLMVPKLSAMVQKG